MKIDGNLRQLISIISGLLRLLLLLWALFRSATTKDAAMLKATACLGRTTACRIGVGGIGCSQSSDIGQSPLFHGRASLCHASCRNPHTRGKAKRPDRLGVLAFGILSNGTCFLITEIFYGFIPYIDWVNWLCIMAAAWLNLLIMLGWINVDRGRRLVNSIAGVGSRLFGAANKTGPTR